MKIMIVDDHTAMRKVLKSVASLYVTDALEFIECDSGEEAVKQYPIAKPDCVLMDVQLKHMNGFDATKQIRSQHSDANVVIVTSFDTFSIRLKAETLSVNGFISKDNLFELKPILQSIQSA